MYVSKFKDSVLTNDILGIILCLPKQSLNTPHEELEDLTPLEYAICNGSSLIVDLLLEAGADVNRVADEMRTPLHMATRAGDLDMMRLLIKAGADLEAKNKSYLTPLLTSVVDNKPANVVQVLIEAGADVNAKDKDMWTPLHFAVIANKSELVEALLFAGAEPHVRTGLGRTPFDMVRSEEIGKLLSLV